MKKKRFIITLVGLVLLTVMAIYFRSLSSEVAKAFITLEERLDEANEMNRQKSDSIASVLTTGYGLASDRGRFLDSVSKQLQGYLTSLKSDMERSVAKDGFEAWESSGFLDALFFEGATISSGGHEFIGRIDVYRMAVSGHFKKDYPEIIERMEEDFSTAPVLDNVGRQQNWLPYNFKGFPLVATMTKISQMESDINRIKLELFSALVNSEE
jgi:hypothetical protein